MAIKTEAELREKLERLLEVKKRHTHESRVCSQCGQIYPIFDTWIFGDFLYLEGGIAALQWVLGEIEHLSEDHT